MVVAADLTKQRAVATRVEQLLIECHCFVAKLVKGVPRGRFGQAGIKNVPCPRLKGNAVPLPLSLRLVVMLKRC